MISNLKNMKNIKILSIFIKMAYSDNKKYIVNGNIMNKEDIDVFISLGLPVHKKYK